MGADVAASPHCPFAVVTKPGRRGRPFRAVSKPVPGRSPETVLRSPAGACASTGFPAGSPTRAGGPGGSPIGGSDSLAATVPSPASTGRGPSPRSTEALGRSLGSAWHSHAACASKVRHSQLPDTRPGPARPILEPKPDFRPVAVGICIPAAGQSVNRSPRSAWFGSRPRRFGNPGRSTKLATLTSAKGQARSFRTAAASSAAPPLPDRAIDPEGSRAPVRLRLWLGSFRPFPAGRFGHTHYVSWKMIRANRNLPVDNEENGHKIGRTAKSRDPPIAGSRRCLQRGLRAARAVPKGTHLHDGGGSREHG